MRRRALTALVLGACTGTGPVFLGAQPSWRAGEPGPVVFAPAPASAPIVFAPAGAPASHYNAAHARVPAASSGSAPSSALDDAVIDAIRVAAGQAGQRAPEPDARLFRACADLAAVVPEQGIINYTLVEFALQREGIIEPLSHLLVWWGPIDSASLIVKQLQPRFAELLAELAPEGSGARLGVGVARRGADGSGAVVFALQSSNVSTAPIPRAVASGDTATIDAVLDPGYADPKVFVTHDDGGIEQLAVGPGRPSGFVAKLACASHRGRQQVEITATGATGVTVLANFPMWCGDAPPSSLTVEPVEADAPAMTTDAAEQHLLADVNHERAAAHLPPLAWDDRIAGVARGHSEEMRRTHVVAHLSPTTGTVTDRLRAGHVETGVALENVARAYGIGAAHRGLMNSPGHRANILSPVATHVGIGVTFDDAVAGRREVFITQVFTRVPPPIDRPRVIEAVRQKLMAVRPTLAAKPALAALAQQFADALAAGATPEAVKLRFQGQLDELNRRYQGVSSLIATTVDIDWLDGARLLGDSVADNIGIAVSQGRHPELGDNAIWVVLLLARNRLP